MDGKTIEGLILTGGQYGGWIVEISTLEVYTIIDDGSRESAKFTTDGTTMIVDG